MTKTQIATSESTGEPVISAKRLSVHYGAKCVLRDVNLDIAAGQVTALIGPSGCGKTSFLQCMNRLSDLTPNCRVSGVLTMHGTSLLANDLDLLSHRRRVGMIFQKPNPFPMSIWRNLELPLREHGERDRETIAERIETALRDVGLWEEVSDRLKSSALKLSGGQQQRLCLARALVLNPEVVLLDEPCSALDPISSSVVEDLILSLTPAITVVVVTHNIAQARRLANHVAMFWTVDGVGEIVEAGAVDAIFEQPQSEITAAYLDGVRG